jgi:hypothetical protein
VPNDGNPVVMENKAANINHFMLSLAYLQNGQKAYSCWVLFGRNYTSSAFLGMFAISQNQNHVSL